MSENQFTFRKFENKQTNTAKSAMSCRWRQRWRGAPAETKVEPFGLSSVSATDWSKQWKVLWI